MDNCLKNIKRRQAYVKIMFGCLMGNLITLMNVYPATYSIWDSKVGVSGGAAAFADYDNDSDLDFLLTGYTNSRIAKLYENRASIFSEARIIWLHGVWKGSIALGDYDNDSDLDILLTGSDASNNEAVIMYRNTGGSFSEITDIPFPGVESSSIATGDYDNDGDLDILYTGYSSNGSIAKVYKNTKGDFNEDTDISLPDVYCSSVAFGDYDNDGDLDILIAGRSNNVQISQIYKNTKGRFSEDTSITLPGVYHSSVAFGDYDNDGDLDILIAGDTGSDKITKVYRNSAGIFSEDTNSSLTGVCRGSVSFGDFDNDGDLDILICGSSDNGYIAKVYRNIDHFFYEVTDISISGVFRGASIFGDYDNDGDLDILIAGDSTYSNIASLYKNNSAISNTAPTAPSDLTSVITSEGVILSWSAGSDAETITPSGLNYNLRMGSSPGGCEIAAPMSLNNGYRQITARGMIQTLTTLVNLPNGEYYWSVQTIDTAFSGSTFSSEAYLNITLPEISAISNKETPINTTFSIPFVITDTDGGNFPISVDSSDLTLITNENICLTGPNIITDGIGYTLVATPGIPEEITMTIIPTNGMTGISTLTIQIMDNGVMVERSFQTIISIFTEKTGLTVSGVSSSSAAFADYDNDGDLDLLVTGSTSYSKIAFLYENKSGIFSDDSIISLHGVWNGSIAFGDYDNDGDLDILSTGTDANYNQIAKIYQNTGGNFTEMTDISLPGVRYSSVVFGDYDNDGDLDILITGYTGGTQISRVFRNTEGSFSEDTDINLPAVYLSSVAFGDYDNDSDLDILITGDLGDLNRITQLYQNTEGSFSKDTNISFPGVDHSSVAFGDYDNDGDLDILITGNTNTMGTSKIAKLYQNTESGFSEYTGNSFPGVSHGSVAFGDYDNDGDLDILISGNTGSSKITKLYRNTEGNFTEETGASFPGVDNSSVSFGDYDNDGDLDILITGGSDSGNIAKIFCNNSVHSNSAPSAPSNLTAIVSGETVFLSWSAGSDAETISTGLNYNLKIGANSNSCEIVSPMALPLSSGYRLISASGFIQSLSKTIHINEVGTYYWRVQTIDTSFSGSAFSNEYSFTVTDVAPVPGSNGQLSPSTFNPYESEVILNWDSASDAVSLSTHLEYRVYTSTVSYSHYIHLWEDCSTAVSNWLINTNTYTISDMNVSTDYYFAVIVRDESGNKAIYEPLHMILFSDRVDINLEGVSNSSAVFGDYDNDGDLDIVVTGFNQDYDPIAKVYQNTSGNFVEDTNISLPGVSYGSATFGDYDNDEDLDILISGSSNNGTIAKVYRNTDGSFREDTDIALTGVEFGSSEFGDYDNDGDLDIIISGSISMAESIVKIYRNTEGNFREDIGTPFLVQNPVL